MSGEAEVAELDRVALVDQNIVGFYVSVHDAHAVEVGHDTDQLHSDLSFIGLGQGCLFPVDEIEERPLFDVLHDEQQLGRRGDGPEHEDDVGVPVLGEHVHFVVELVQQVLGYVRIEDLLYRHLQLEEAALVDRAEPAHRNLLPTLQV